MVKQTFRFVLILMAILFVFACDTTKKVDFELEVAVSLDGKPVSQARVLVDGTQIGSTDDRGYYMQKMQKLPGQEVQVTVTKEASGYRIESWKDSFVTKLPKEGVVDKYAFKADLKATRYFTLLVSDDGEPVDGAAIRIQGKSVAQTDENGELVYEYQKRFPKGFKVGVTKKGYKAWQKTIRLKPGQLYEVALAKKAAPKKAVAAAPVKKPQKIEKPKETAQPAAKQPAPAAAPAPKKAKPQISKATLYVAAFTQAYGTSTGLPGVTVSVNGQKVGKTNSKGAYTYSYKGKAVEQAKIKLSAPGYIPQEWETSVALKGKQRVQRYFYPAKPPPIRVGIYGYINNSPDQDLTEVIERVEEAIANNLFIFGGFSEVPKESLRAMMLQSNMDMETATTKGWKKTSLIKSVDMIVTGSVTQDQAGMTIETTVITADGNILLSQINRARKIKNIKNTAKLIVGGIIDQFPFEGTVAAVENDVYSINLGKLDHKIRRGNVFRFMVADLDKSGRLKGYREAGLLRTVETDEEFSHLEIDELNEGGQVQVGDRVIRRIYLDEQRETEQASAVVMAKGGVTPNEKPLWGVNVYLNNSWVGTTGAKGTVTIPISLLEEHDILLSRHGYQQFSDTISIDTDQEVKEFILDVANAVFKVESEPSNAQVFVDGVNIGQTPMTEGELVNFGFRKIKLSVGGDFRDWEQVIEFNRPEVDRTGDRKIVFLKDYLKIGRRAEKKGQVDTAIGAYAAIERENPDYSVARCRLAQLYMDEKNDYDAAIKEFEKVLSLPENKQIIYKQFAVTYTNLGHAYYEKGNALAREDRRAAAGNFAKAIKKLDKAKQNTRFFPSSSYHAAVHDTYYYRALSYHKLYLVTKKRALIHKADRAWQEYFDFFPKKLEKKSNFVALRSGAKKYWNQIKDLN
jgi:tetratricopeptide (TPR) repeat protein